jgi:signal transduction histidine kinase
MLLLALVFIPPSAWETFVPTATVLGIVGGLGIELAAERSLRPLRRLARSIEDDRLGEPSLEQLVRGAPPEVAPVLYGLHLTHTRLRRSLRQIEQDRADVATIFEHMTDSVLVLDGREHILLSNPAAARRDFVANVSHELRTPVAAVKALVETLEQGAIDDPVEGPAFLHRMHVEVDGLAQLVAELLDLARAEAGRLELDFAPCRADELVRDAVERMLPTARQVGIDAAVEVDAAKDDLWVRADARRLGQVLSNLLANAVKFTPAHGRIVAGTLRAGGRVELWVVDTGVGIEPQHLGRVFERFYESDPARAAGSGTGLGLAIAKHLVLAHGGDIRAESGGAGRGAIFRVSLPAIGEGGRQTGDARG